MPGRWRRTRALLPRGTKLPKLKPSKGAIRTAAGFRFTRSELIVKLKSRKRKQKKMLSERLEEPIEGKTGGRV